MKKFLLLLFGIVFSLSVQAQSNITIGLVMPSEELNGIRPDAFSLLQSKLDKVLTSDNTLMVVLTVWLLVSGFA